MFTDRGGGADGMPNLRSALETSARRLASGGAMESSTKKPCGEVSRSLDGGMCKLVYSIRSKHIHLDMDS